MARVLFVCLHNAGRSQMSEALFTRAGAGRHEARSAGTNVEDLFSGAPLSDGQVTVSGTIEDPESPGNFGLRNGAHFRAPRSTCPFVTAHSL